MAIYYSVFGRKCMNMAGDVWYAAMNSNGSVNSYELRPSYNHDKGVWEPANEESDVAYDCEEGSYPDTVDPSKCLFEIGEIITIDNWKDKSIEDDQFPLVELSRLLTYYGANKKNQGHNEALYYNQLISDIDSGIEKAADEKAKSIFDFVKGLKKNQQI